MFFAWRRGDVGRPYASHQLPSGNNSLSRSRAARYCDTAVGTLDGGGLPTAVGAGGGVGCSGGDVMGGGGGGVGRGMSSNVGVRGGRHLIEHGIEC